MRRAFVLAAVLVCPATAQPDPRSAATAMHTAMAKQRAAAVLQREAARIQAEFAARFRRNAPVTVTAADPLTCPALSENEISGILDAASKRHELPIDLLRAVIRQESGFRPCAVSVKGAKGLMQLMPATAAQFSVRDPFDPAENVQAGTRYLKELLGRYNGDLKLALGAYNAGPGNVSESAGLPPFAETRNYVGAIMEAIEPVTPLPSPSLPAIRPNPPPAR